MSRPPNPPLSPAWESAVDDWISHLKLRGLSEETRRLRREHVRGIARRSGTHRPSDITGPQLADLCRARDWGAEHRRAIRASLRSFYGYCAKTEVVTGDPTDVLPIVKPSSPCPRPATDDIWVALLAKAAPRERLMARLAGEAGMRRAEVAVAHHDDLIRDWGGWSLIVHGKGGKQRVVPITDRLADEISAYCQHGYLFPGGVDGHISVVYVGQLISGLMPEGWSMHKLRHYADGRVMCPAKVIRLVGTVPVVVSST